MINDENSLGEAMVELTRTIANAIDLFEAKADTGMNVKFLWTKVGRSVVIEDEPMIRVSIGAKLNTGTEVFNLQIHGDD